MINLSSFVKIIISGTIMAMVFESCSLSLVYTSQLKRKWDSVSMAWVKKYKLFLSFSGVFGPSISPCFNSQVMWNNCETKMRPAYIYW